MELSKSDYEEMGVKRIPRKKKKALKKKIDRFEKFILEPARQHAKAMVAIKMRIHEDDMPGFVELICDYDSPLLRHIRAQEKQINKYLENETLEI